VRVALAVALIVAALGRARGDDARCARGIAWLRRGDLPRAALYLDGCDDDATAAARRELHRRLEASDLAVVEIVTRPAGLPAEIDALPGEHFTTPATLWVPAGTYGVRAGALAGNVTTKPRARSVVYLDGGLAAQPATPRPGTVDFSEESAATPAETGPPPDVPHGTMLPCKFAGTCPGGGDHIDDPLATRASAAPRYPRMQIEPSGGAVYTNTSGLSPSVALGVHVRAPWQGATVERPWSFDLRGAWDRRGGHNEWSTAGGVAKVVVAMDDVWLAPGVALGYSSFDGAMACALLRLAFRRVPVMLGAIYEQGLAHTGDRAVVVELGAALRR
jgi:hypothetical protein